MNPSRKLRGFAVMLLVASSACATAPGGMQASPSGAGVVEEARAFMDAYGRDLLAGNRTAIAARYDRRGAYFMGNGQKEFETYEAIVARYAGPNWNPPAAFEWRDLSFEPAGPDAVIVAGRFVWGRQGRAPMTLSYTGFLHRQDGVLRIRLEDESVDPRAVAPPAQRDTTNRGS